jgi:hypothetical protein
MQQETQTCSAPSLHHPAAEGTPCSGAESAHALDLERHPDRTASSPGGEQPLRHLRVEEHAVAAVCLRGVEKGGSGAGQRPQTQFRARVKAQPDGDSIHIVGELACGFGGSSCRVSAAGRRFCARVLRAAQYRRTSSDRRRPLGQVLQLGLAQGSRTADLVVARPSCSTRAMLEAASAAVRRKLSEKGTTRRWRR